MLPTPDAPVVVDIDAPITVDAPPEPLGYDLPLDPAYQGLADAIEAERISKGIANAAVLMMIDGQVVFAQGFGEAGRGDGVKTYATTLFRIGSVTKMLTTTALLQEVEAGRVDLEAPITTYLPAFELTSDPGGADSIHVAHALSHTSALYDYLRIASATDDSALLGFVEDGLDAASYRMAPAGRMYNYSNPNFFIAGAIAERTSGVSYRTLLHDRVFAPLGMDRTLFLPSEVFADGDYAIGWSTNSLGNPDSIQPGDYDNAWGRPAGYAFSSVFDLAKFVTFLAEGNTGVLSDAQRLSMQSPHVDTLQYGNIVKYGYALQLQDGIFVGNNFIRTPLVGHGGNINGFSASLMYLPAERFAFITLAGADVVDFDQSLEYALTHYVDLPAPSAPPDVAVDPDTFDRYTGTFLDEHNAGTVIVTHVGDDLYVELPDVDRAGIPYTPKLRAVSRDNFVLAIQGTQILATFLFDETGAVEYFRTRPFVAAVTPGARIAPHAIDAARLHQALVTTEPTGFLLP